MSRSLITGQGSGSSRTVWNPNSSLGGAVNVVTPTVGGGALKLKDLPSFRIIQQDYTTHNANRTYEQIPPDFIAYLNLYQIVVRTQNQYLSNPSVSVLLQITADALTGALNSYGLNTLNVELSVQNTYLQNTIEELLSGQNVNTAYSDSTGTLAMTQTLVLAPLFVYYIDLYGLPEPGVGFDPNKLSIVLAALENSGIDPYAGEP